ncbi:MAG TPA: phospholipase D-like domain-containing protein [Stenomitos sp.]
MSWLNPKPIRQKLQFGLSLVAVGLMLALLLHWCQAPLLTVQALQPLPQHPLIQVYSNHNPAHTYREPYRAQTRPGDNLEQIIVDSIRGAQSTVDLAVQEFRSPLIAQALRDRSQAGVKIRLVIENTYSRPWSRVTAAEAQQMDSRQKSRYRENTRLIDRNADGILSAEEINQNDALVVIERAAIPWIDDRADGSAGSGLMHHKFVVIDGQQVIVTSANFTMSDLHGDFSPKQSLGNANSLVKLQSPAIAQLFSEEFNLMWGDGPGGATDSRFGVRKPFRPAQTVAVGDATVQVKFSPTSAEIPWELSSNGLIGQTLGTGRKRIDMALFVFSDQHIVNALEAVAQKGAAIRVLIEPTFAFQYFSEALDMLGVALPVRTKAIAPVEDPVPDASAPLQNRHNPCRTEADNHPWRNPMTSVGVPQLPPGDLLHHKFGLVDQHTVITGSHNWTEAADRNNDEAVLVIDHPTVAAHYEREYERLWATSRLGLPSEVQTATAAFRQSCSALSAGSTRPSAAPSPSTRINLNTATQAELEQLPGVGPKLAQRMIAAREKEPFRSLADVDRVPGVGKKLLQEISDRITW